MRRNPVAEGGAVAATFEDAYGWLEEESDEALAWQARESTAAERHLRGLPGFERLAERLGPALEDLLLFAPQPAAGRRFELGLGDGGLVLSVSESPGDAGRVIVDPNADGPEQPLSLDWAFPSPDGRLVAYGVSAGGNEQSVLHVLDVDSDVVLPERIPHTSFGKVAWLPDSSGFYVNVGRAPDTVDAQKSIVFHRPGRPAPDEPEPLELREEFCFPQVSADGRHVAVVPSEIEPRPDWVKRLPDGEWRPFLRDVPGLSLGVFAGDEYVAVTTDDAPRGRLVAIPVDAGADRSAWRELLPEGDGVMRSVSLAGEQLVLSELAEGACSRIRILSLDGEPLDEVPLPGEGLAATTSAWWGSVVIEPMVNTGDGELDFVFASYTTPPAVYRYELATRRLERLSPPHPGHPDLVERLLSCTSRDGARLTFWAVHRRDLDLSQPRPTLIYGYGGWNIAFVPWYVALLRPFVEEGGLLLFPHLRGGGEGGWDWWQQGRLSSKQQTFDDLYAVAEHAIAQGWTTPELLAVAGASNGGLLAAVAATQRPDLFRAVVSLVPVIDLLNFTRDSYTAECTEEYGDPADPADAAVLTAYSPYHNVREAAEYPATLFVCGGDDIRCPAWHCRKIAARMRAAQTADRPVLFRLWPGAGHMSGVISDAHQTAEWLGFVMTELGMLPAS